MPDIGVFHPIIVHFVIALLVIGIGLRWIWFTGKVPFAGSAAATLLLIGTLAAVLAVKSGEDGHGPLARLPAPEDDQGRSRAGILQADAYLAAGFSDSAHATLGELLENFPDDQRIKDRLAQFR